MAVNELVCDVLTCWRAKEPWVSLDSFSMTLAVKPIEYSCSMCF